MKVTNIVVRAGRTFNHPHEQYSNLKPEVELRAELSDSDNPSECAKALQAQAEGLVEDHKQGLLKSINELYDMTAKQTEMIGLQRQLTSAQSRLDEIRRQHPVLAQLSAPTDRFEGDPAFTHIEDPQAFVDKAKELNSNTPA